ncbi:hypothetical protein [Bacillus mycoides]|uniref:hypothetical protein n=1 Tax=Bacillus mycoides TaxID=1405 RepID=UPI000278CF50|nr:hypothetical protein [Bacillus mycoides]EJQ61589.1 hypothetical protein IEW_02153 [Bacillus mycoides]EJQ62996.1 hypothetical protein IEY_03179 [Bacillus mycoides]EJV69167.1 hypothetical protein IEU_02156 [Bacillus mycoides]MDR4304117.1 hypothetical protein [Bacillus mycoides]
MENISVLKDGLSIISQCKKETNDIWHAHFGAAAIASYFFTKNNNIDEKTACNIYSQAKMMLHKQRLGETINNKQGVDYQSAEETIIKSLEQTIDELHWVGHNVIYASLSLLAIKELSHWGSEQDINNIANLILSFQKTIPGRSWIGFTTKEVKQLIINNEEIQSEIKNPKQLSEFVLNELSEFNVIYKAESHQDLIGHMLTFSHAINILYDLGHIELFQRGIKPLLKLVYVLRKSRNLMPNAQIILNSPVDRLPLTKAKQVDTLPLDNAFWLKDYSEFNWDFGHIFKFSYSYFDHLTRVPEYKDKTFEKFCCIINE